MNLGNSGLTIAIGELEGAHKAAVSKLAKSKRRHTCKHEGFNSKCRECHKARQCSFREFILGNNKVRERYINLRRGGFQTDIRNTLVEGASGERREGKRGRDFQEEERNIRGRSKRGRS